MQLPLSGEFSSAQHDFATPFAVRDARGRLFHCRQNEGGQCTEPSQTADWKPSAGYVNEQREQRQSETNRPSRPGANIESRETDISNMTTAMQHPSMKRKHSADCILAQASKRPRTLSESQLRAAITVIREILPGVSDSEATMLTETPHSGELNPLKHLTASPYSLKCNPLHGFEERPQSLESNSLRGNPGEMDEPHAMHQAGKLENPLASDSSVYIPMENMPRQLEQISTDSAGPSKMTVSNEFEKASDDTYGSMAPSEPFKTTPTIDSALRLVAAEVDGRDTQSYRQSSSFEHSEQLQILETLPVNPSESPLGDIGGLVTQRHQTHERSAAKPSKTHSSTQHDQRKLSPEDQQFVQRVKAVLRNQGKWKTASVGRRQARRIGDLLELAKPPDASEALFASEKEAAQQLDFGNYFPGPIITENQQPLPLQTSTQFLNEYYDESAKVWIQDPAILLARNIPHAREITIGQLKQRVLQGVTKGKIPWNCLEMATHVEDGLRPSFLNNEDCRLLTKLKLPNSGESASRRGYEPGWKEVEKWALLAQGGALTEPHQDSHGYSTYITVNQGTMGFGWLSNPTPEERLAWRANPATYIGGRWRYVVLRPGQTIFFPSGTVHFVFRLASLGDTLAFGGHVLRCSQIVRWIETMLEEKAGADITNEELTVSAPAYLERVERFVNQARKTGQMERWGGAEAIEKFLLLKEKFMSGYGML